MVSINQMYLLSNKAEFCFGMVSIIMFVLFKKTTFTYWKVGSGKARDQISKSSLHHTVDCSTYLSWSQIYLPDLPSKLIRWYVSKYVCLRKDDTKVRKKSELCKFRHHFFAQFCMISTAFAFGMQRYKKSLTQIVPKQTFSYQVAFSGIILHKNARNICKI